MFYGTENRILDERGRISLPRKIVEKLGSQPLVIKRGQVLLVYPEERKGDFIPSRVEEVRIDTEGRLCLPLKIIHAIPVATGKKVTLTGEGNHLAIRPRRRLSYEELTIKEAEELWLRGISVVPNADRKEVILSKN